MSENQRSAISIFRQPFIRRMLLPLLLTYLACLFAAVHFVPAGILERDGYYHARLAQIYPQRLLSRSFPWTQASTWRDHYCDKEFLFHVLMVPFTRDSQEPIVGAKVFSLLLSLAVFATLFLVLRANSVRFPLLFTSLLACMGGMFLVRLTMIRSHVLSMILALLGMHLLLGRRWKALMVLGFIYAWSYTFPFVLLLLALPFVVGRRLAGGDLDWRSLVAAPAGVLLGLAIHPYSPLTLETFLTYLQVVYVGILGEQTSGFELGAEFYSQNTLTFLTTYPLLNAMVIGLCLAGWRMRVKLTPEGMGALCTAIFWFLMTMLSPRFAEYAAPLAVLALALIARDVLAERASGAGGDSTPKLKGTVRALGLAVITLLIVGFHAHSVQFFVKLMANADPPRFREAAAWMTKNLPPDTKVLNLYWGDFPDLFYDGSRQHYFWGLDPTYTLRDNREKALLLEGMRQATLPLDGAKIIKTFGARILILKQKSVPYYPELVSGAVKLVYIDRYAAIFDLTQRGSPLTRQ